MILRYLGRLSLLALPVLALLALPAAQARADIFTVSGVELDATGESVTAAREQAMAEGQVQAVERLWERLVPPDQRPLIPPLSAADLSNYYVQNLSVSGERTSTNRYIAELTVQFQPDQIRQFLRSNGIAYAETRSQPVLVLPLYGPEESAVLWAGENPWLAAWQQHETGNELVPLVTPLGDLADLTTVDAPQALAGDEEALRDMAERYGAGDVLVTRAVQSGDPEAGTASLEIATQRYPEPEQSFSAQSGQPAQSGAPLQPPGPPPGPTTERLTQQPEETLEDLLARGAAAVSSQVQANWLVQNQLRYDQQSQLQATVPVNTLNELVEVQRRLSRVAAVRDYYTLSVTRTAAEVGLVYYGDPIQLQRALSQVDLALEQRPTVMPGQSAWQLRLTQQALEIDTAPLGGSGGLVLEQLPGSSPAGQAAPGAAGGTAGGSAAPQPLPGSEPAPGASGAPGQPPAAPVAQ